MRPWPIHAALMLATCGSAARAHPVHEVVQNAYVTIGPGTVRLQLDLTAGPEVAGRILQALDSDRDRRITRTEADGYADRVLRASHLVVDGHTIELHRVSVDIPPPRAILGAHGTFTIVAEAALPTRTGLSTLVYRNGYAPAESRCDANIFFSTTPRATYRVLALAHGPDGRALAVRYRVAMR